MTVNDLATKITIAAALALFVWALTVKSYTTAEPAPAPDKPPTVRRWTPDSRRDVDCFIIVNKTTVGDVSSISCVTGANRARLLNGDDHVAPH